MVKGVNKNIIEINETGSEVFERIVFFVSPKFSNVGAKKLLEESGKFTFAFDSGTNRKYRSLRRKMIIRRRLFLCGVGAAVLGVAAVIYLIF